MFLNIIALAREISYTDLPNNSYIIGTNLYTKNVSLSTKNIMLAAKSIESDELYDMIIYYKNPRGKLIDVLGQKELTPPSKFIINYQDVTSTNENHVEYFTINKSNDEIPNNSYIIGTYLFNGTSLTTQHIMLAAKSIEDNELNEMVIYYKNPRGKWYSVLSGNPIDNIDTIKISHVNMTPQVNVTTPVVDDIEGGTSAKTISQELTLKCNDAMGVTAYYFGTTEPTSASMITSTNSSDLVALTSEIGLKERVTAAGTYWLACKNYANNYDKKSIRIVNYTINELLEEINGVTDIYTSDNYISKISRRYIIKSGSSLNIENSFVIPPGASTDTVKGFSDIYSTTPANLSNTITSVVNSKVYYIWLNRKTYDIIVEKPNNGNIKIETVTQENNSVTTTTKNVSLKVKYGDTVKATAIPSDGYGFGSWSGNYLSGNGNPVIGEAIIGSKTISATFNDVTSPVISDIEGGTNYKTINQELTLKCNDNVDVTAYYFGTTDPTNASMITTANNEEIIALTSSNGLTKTVTEVGTYYFACKDAANNYAKKNIVIVNYTVKNLLEKITGIKDTYTSDNYTLESNNTYIIKDGTTMSSENMYTIPTGALDSTFKGYSKTNTATTSTISNAAIVVESNQDYYMWFNRSTYTVTVEKPTGGAIKIETITQSDNSITALVTAAELTVKYGDTVKATATPNDGFIFDSWGGGYLTGSTNPSTGSSVNSNKTIIGTFIDNTNPVINAIEGGTTPKSASQILTLKCSDNDQIAAYYFGTMEPTASMITNTDSDDLAALTSETGLTKKIVEQGTYYFSCKDASNNINNYTKIIMLNYTVKNLLESLNGNNYDEVSSNQYLIAKETVIPLEDLYNIPEGASSDTFNSCRFSALPCSANITMLSNNIYEMRFDRITYAVTIMPSLNGFITAETVSQEGNSATTSKGIGTLTVKHGDTVRGTATGMDEYGFTGWSGGYLMGNTNPQIGPEVTSDQTISASFELNY
jgi:hypothetical protein